MATIAEYKNLMNNPGKMVDFIVNLIGEDADCVVGLRGLYNNENPNKLQKSYEWVDGNRTSRRLPGTCALLIAADWKYATYGEIAENIKRIARMNWQYGDGRLALVVGTRGTAGEDIGEIVIANAKAIYTWE